jgi:hypothetical protein
VSDRDITKLLEQSVGPLDNEHGDWERILEDAGETPGIEERHLTRLPSSHRRRGLLAFAAAIAVAALALTIASPWHGGPSILDRAAAAIAAPTSGQILEESIAIHAGPFNPDATANMHLWLDSAPPRRFRVTRDRQPRFHLPPATFGGRRVPGMTVPPEPPVEFGGILGSASVLSYAFADGVLDPAVLDFRVSQSDVDPVAFVTAALASGHAQLAGRTTIRGREVLRIRVTSHPFFGSSRTELYFVDAHTYRPVRFVIAAGVRPFGRAPVVDFFLRGVTGSPWPVIFDFAKYRYLAPTPANRKLADIRAQHPHAKIL